MESVFYTCNLKNPFRPGAVRNTDLTKELKSSNRVHLYFIIYSKISRFKKKKFKCSFKSKFSLRSEGTLFSDAKFSLKQKNIPTLRDCVCNFNWYTFENK